MSIVTSFEGVLSNPYVCLLSGVVLPCYSRLLYDAASETVTFNWALPILSAVTIACGFCVGSLLFIIYLLCANMICFTFSMQL